MSTKLTKINNYGLSDWISQAEAARLRGISRQAVAKLIKKGRLKVFIIGGHTLVSKLEILNFEPKVAGRPKASTKVKNVRKH
jgi:excisionase family DNA binding protein